MSLLWLVCYDDLLCYTQYIHLIRSYTSCFQKNPVLYLKMFPLTGTLFLWMFWPSFNSAISDHGDGQHRAAINTYLALAASVLTTFAISSLSAKKGKLDMVNYSTSLYPNGVCSILSAFCNIAPVLCNLGAYPECNTGWGRGHGHSGRVHDHNLRFSHRGLLLWDTVHVRLPGAHCECDRRADLSVICAVKTDSFIPAFFLCSPSWRSTWRFKTPVASTTCTPCPGSSEELLVPSQRLLPARVSMDMKGECECLVILVYNYILNHAKII